MITSEDIKKRLENIQVQQKEAKAIKDDIAYHELVGYQVALEWVLSCMKKSNKANPPDPRKPTGG
jgi:hypothetical protein